MMQVSPIQISIEALVDLEHPSEAQISPNGDYVAFVLGKANRADKDSTFEKTIYLIDTATREVRGLTPPQTGTNDQPRWSPDGTRIAFLTNGGDYDEMQLYMMDMDGKAQPLTNLRGKVDAPKWTNDGRSIAFLYNGTLDPQKYTEPDPIVVDAAPRFNRVWMLNLDTGDLRAITPHDQHVFEYDLSPDGKTLAVLLHAHPNPYQGWYSAQLHTVDVASGALNRVCTVKQQIGRLTWSPDSTQIAFVSGVMSDEGNISGEVYTVPATGGEPKSITPGIDHSVTWIEWRDDGIAYGGRQIEDAVLGVIEPESEARRLISKGMFSINGYGAQRIHAGRADKFVAVRSSFSEPANIYMGSLETGEWTSLTELSPVLPPLQVENKYWRGADGTAVHGYVVYPPGYTPGKRYPLFAHVHGGPSWSYVPSYGSIWDRLLTARGCVVLLPNPRGSWGRGHGFQSANVGDLGGGDWQDIQAGVDTMIAEGIADPEHMAIGGWSYGGYLTAWAVTQTDRFRCAIAGASITNYESNYGVVLNREWQTTMFGSNVYDDFELHRSRSPIAFAHRVKTPTLLVHGDRDIYAPVEQSIEFYTALRYYDVPAQLVIYPREPHGFQERAHQIDLYQRIGSWVDQYLFG